MRVSLITTFAYVPIALALGPVGNLPIVNKEIAPDGFSRPTVLANGIFPGELITGTKGDTFQINVQDQLNDTRMLRSTTIHWHGFFQKNSNWADGPAGVTQCPIATGDSFVYEFGVPDQAGTFWYHSHLSTQYCDGLRGAMVVYDPADPHLSLYDVDDDNTVITLADWYHALAPTIIGVGTPDSTLINGKGRYNGGSLTNLTRINVVRGRRYRLRIVSLSCDPSFTFAIHGHNMTIIEADGVNTQPLVVDSLEIFAGQRYSVVVHANQRIGNYWIRANPSFGTIGFAGGLNSAVLHYIGASSSEPAEVDTEPVSSSPFVETALRPLENPGAPGLPQQGGADVNLNLAIDLTLDPFQFTMNGAPFIPPSLPVLLQVMSGARTAQELLPEGSVYTLPPNQTVEISIPGGSAGAPHPFHLHGHTFDVVRSAGSTDYNYANPIRRDVVNTGLAGDNTTIRFRTDNAGPWILHCHIDWHLDIGLAVVMAEDTDSMAESVQPTAYGDLCPKYDSLSDDELGGLVD
ncbi:multicopper oxidase [Schizophyllum commune H4-8]|uniref:Multicopper oxidase/laccase n=1 Tax=Schizophyllum commune (strain H4-8 / FGSC 9210) TaxID=578458 RepID=D8QME3_SCHCM|nr:multicopper oxidase [Schizophyllum commune H4-8]KAI5836564.1 multicopper oxidase [Schizophyllum commune H4-8]